MSRREHYGQFYGLRPLPDGDGPLVVVHGNCQAESLRVLLAGAGGCRTVRLPPAHELTADDVPDLDRVVCAADALVSQPVSDGYRDLPVGAARLAGLVGGGRGAAVVVPALRWAALHPYQVVVRHPDAGEMAVVPYHDLRTLLEASTGAAPHPAPAHGVRALAALSRAHLVRRETDHRAVPAHDLLEAAGADATQVVNHPGNAVLVGLAARVRRRLGLDPSVPDPGRTLLDSVHAPVDEATLGALGLDAPPRPDWRVGGATLPDEEVRELQLAWYREHPEVAPAALARHADAVEALWGWSP